MFILKMTNMTKEEIKKLARAKIDGQEIHDRIMKMI